MNYLTIAKSVSLSKKTDPEPHRHGVVVQKELIDLYLSAVSEISSTWLPEVGPFIDSNYPELRRKAESASKKLGRVWRAVADGKLDVSGFQQALGAWQDRYHEQIETFKQHGHTWAASLH